MHVDTVQVQITSYMYVHCLMCFSDLQKKHTTEGDIFLLKKQKLACCSLIKCLNCVRDKMKRVLTIFSCYFRCFFVFKLPDSLMSPASFLPATVSRLKKNSFMELWAENPTR